MSFCPGAGVLAMDFVSCLFSFFIYRFPCMWCVEWRLDLEAVLGCSYISMTNRILGAVAEVVHFGGP